MQMKSEIAGEAAKQRHIQRGIDAKDKSKGNGKQQGARPAPASIPNPPSPSNINPSLGMNGRSSRRRCMMRRTILDRRNSMER